MTSIFRGALDRSEGKKLSENLCLPRSSDWIGWRKGWQRLDRAINRELGNILNDVQERNEKCD